MGLCGGCHGDCGDGGEVAEDEPHQGGSVPVVGDNLLCIRVIVAGDDHNITHYSWYPAFHLIIHVYLR